MSRFIGFPHGARYPHEGACSGCRNESVCNACGKPFSPHPEWNRPYCTNGRCQHCHDEHCTSGGATTPGHGFWRKPPSAEPLEEEAAAAVAEAAR